MEEITWSAPEYHYYEKNVSWYWIVLLMTIFFVGFALWQSNFLFAVFIIIASVLIIAWGKRPPRIITFSLSDKGLSVDEKKFYHFDSVEGFAISPDHMNDGFNELAIQTKGRISGWIKIIIEEEQADAIKALLTKHIEELEYTESLADHLSKLLKF